MKVTNGTHTVETTEFLKNIWIREGYKVVDETEESKDEPTCYKVVDETEESKDEPTYQELKSMAKDKGINTHGMKKEEILEALGM